MSQDHTINGWTVNDTAKLEKQWERGIITAAEVLEALAPAMNDEQLAYWQNLHLLEIAEGESLMP